MKDVFYTLGIKDNSLFNKMHNYTTINYNLRNTKMKSIILEALCLTGSEKVSVLICISDSVRGCCPVEKYYNTDTAIYSSPYLCP